MKNDNTEFITVNGENIDREHICCALGNKKGDDGADQKKAWLTDRFADGLVFRRLNQRGKAFIEYIPAEKAWYPIDAEGYMHIDCFWISGQFKGKGHSNQLLDYCIADAREKGRKGLTVISSEKKRSYLSDAGYMKHRGFIEADTAGPYFVLYYLPFTQDAPVPLFRPCAKTGQVEEKGLVLYYTNQCPFAEKYAKMIGDIAGRSDAQLLLKKISTLEEAQNAPSPFTTYSLFHNGRFLTNEILSEKKFEKILQEIRQ